MIAGVGEMIDLTMNTRKPLTRKTTYADNIYSEIQGQKEKITKISDEQLIKN